MTHDQYRLTYQHATIFEIDLNVVRTRPEASNQQKGVGASRCYGRGGINGNRDDSIRRRLQRLDPAQPAKWGQLTAPRMLAHLCDQMRMTLSEKSCAPIPSPGRYPIIGRLILYVLPWPKGKILGPPEAFVTSPTEWESDLDTLRGLVERFVSEESRDAWPDHPHFGRMSRRDWGVFCHRHFDHHLRQFSA